MKIEQKIQIVNLAIEYIDKCKVFGLCYALNSSMTFLGIDYSKINILEEFYLKDYKPEDVKAVEFWWDIKNRQIRKDTLNIILGRLNELL